MFIKILLIGQGIDGFEIMDMIFSIKPYWKKVKMLYIVRYTRFVYISKSFKSN